MEISYTLSSISTLRDMMADMATLLPAELF
jgi:hypothetical protein